MYQIDVCESHAKLENIDAVLLNHDFFTRWLAEANSTTSKMELSFKMLTKKEAGVDALWVKLVKCEKIVVMDAKEKESVHDDTKVLFGFKSPTSSL